MMTTAGWHWECVRCYARAESARDFARSDLDKARTRVATLEAALRPFAESPFSGEKGEPYERLLVEEWSKTPTGLTVGDLQRARAALAGKAGEGDDKP